MRSRIEKRFATWVSILALLILPSCAAVAASTSDSNLVEIVILHTNDVHGNVRPFRAGQRSSDSAPMLGGSASLATFLKRERAARGGDTGVLLVDAGDIYQGTPEGNETRGRLMVEIMNALRYDAGALGNHEFDFGIENVRELMRLARFTWMAGNLRDSATGEVPAEVESPVIAERSGVRIGIAGIVTDDLATLSNLENRWWTAKEIPSAAAAAADLVGRGAEMVILVSHCGVDRDSGIANYYDAASLPEGAAKPRIDLIVGGHSHTRLETAAVIRGIPIVQTGARCQAVGEVRVLWNRSERRIESFEYELHDLYNDRYPPDSEMTAFLEPWIKDLEEKMNRVVGFAPKPIHRGFGRYGSSPLGNLQTDLMRAATGAEIAFQNRGGIRADVPAGALKLRDLYTVSPFGNTVVRTRLTGRQVKAVCEHSLGRGYTPLEVSGLTVYYDRTRPIGDRVVNIFVGREPLDPDREYVVATNNFLGAGGDGYFHFKEGRDYRDTGRNFLDVEVANYEAHPEGVTAPEEERWRDVENP
jgi:2',3'-cyclic-nucleotide 2'-phosphodiesterase (5'-nucleotidase family)